MESNSSSTIEEQRSICNIISYHFLGEFLRILEELDLDISD